MQELVVLVLHLHLCQGLITTTMTIILAMVTMIIRRIGHLMLKVKTDKYMRPQADLKHVEAELAVPLSKLKAPFLFTLRISATLGMKCIIIIVIFFIINDNFFISQTFIKS